MASESIRAVKEWEWIWQCNPLTLKLQGERHLLGRSIFGLGPRMYLRTPELFAYRWGNRVPNVRLILEKVAALAVEVSPPNSVFTWAMQSIELTRVDEVVGLGSHSIAPVLGEQVRESKWLS